MFLFSFVNAIMIPTQLICYYTASLLHIPAASSCFCQIAVSRNAVIVLSDENLRGKQIAFLSSDVKTVRLQHPRSDYTNW